MRVCAGRAPFYVVTCLWDHPQKRTLGPMRTRSRTPSVDAAQAGIGPFRTSPHPLAHAIVSKTAICTGVSTGIQFTGILICSHSRSVSLLGTGAWKRVASVLERRSTTRWIGY